MIDRLLQATLLLIAAAASSSSSSSSVTGGGGGIPGTQSTLSGYDTEQGRDPICWVSREALAVSGRESNADIIDFPNELLENFRIEGGVELQEACPTGVVLNVTKPELFTHPAFVPRTRKHYNYSIYVELDLQQLEGQKLTSDDGTALVAMQVLVCELGKAGFCSPFVHEQANAREKREGKGKEDREEGDRHGGSHVHSNYVFVDTMLHRVSESQPHRISFTQDVPLIVNDPGDFFVIGAIHFFVTNVTAIRYDVSNALHPNPLVKYQAPPEILVVREGVEWAVWVVIGIACWIILVLFIQTFRHRNHQVLQLSQGRFLLVFLAAAFWATASCFLLNPKNDIYCNMSGPMILIPVQLVYAVTIGRLWRIHRVISPLLLTHYQQAQLTSSWSNSRRLAESSKSRWQRAVQSCWHFLKKFFTCGYFPCFQQSGKPRKIRRQVSASQLGAVVALITIPQILIQILAVVIQPQTMELWYNDGKTVGRYVCSVSDDGYDDFWKTISAYGMVVLVLVNVALLVVAKASQNLPSLFNETHVIFQSTLVNMIVLIIGLAVIHLTDSATTSPEVEFLLWVALVMSITLNSSIRIMWPKLQMVWNNETVLVSKLVSDHNEQQRKKQQKLKGRKDSATTQTLKNVSGFRRDNNNSKKNNNRPYPTSQTHSGAESAGNRSSVDEDQHLRWNSSVTSQHNTSAGGGVLPDDDFVVPVQGVGGGIHGLRRDGKKITVSLNQTPSRLLVLPMVRLQEQLRDITSRITSGLVVTEESWTEFRELASNMAHQMEEDVEFAWEARGRRDDNRASSNSRNMDDFPLILENDEEALEVEQRAKDPPDHSAGAGTNSDQGNQTMVYPKWGRRSIGM